MTEDILSHNFQALNSFSRSIKKNLAKHNNQTVMANVEVTYSWEGGVKMVKTRAMISLNNHPYAKISLTDQDWLTSEDFYTEMQTGYNHFNYDKSEGVLTISNKTQSKMGRYYTVDIKEI
ncbi:hypothetical protein [Pedobacter sp. Leaf194]|uniref:hypothetical protein n=1 Tax=Pedobacter sp. Leaf194 TaxID=1736297 RepID=UPI0007026B73|nr:hypothetical protein [Pedobacter sp. Leaf194]KQS32467.1 hypothetical protein ASG14_16410 [Pedobacter sp. Leaf194]